MDVATLVPLVRSEKTLELQPEPGPEGFVIRLGHETVVMLADKDGWVTPSALAASGLSVEDAHAKALDNLDAAGRDDAVEKTIRNGPEGRQWVLWSCRGIGASCLRIPRLDRWARKILGLEPDTELLASIPQTGSLVIFPSADRPFRDAMRAMIRQAEADAPAPITWELFTLTSEGPVPFEEPDADPSA